MVAVLQFEHNCKLTSDTLNISLQVHLSSMLSDINRNEFCVRFNLKMFLMFAGGLTVAANYFIEEFVGDNRLLRMCLNDC